MKNNKQSGVALVTVLLVAAVTIALAYGALTVSLNTLQGSKAAESSVQARLNAESGLDATFVYLEREFENENQNPFSSPTSSTPIPSVVSGGGISIDRETLFNLHNDLSHQTDSDGNEIYEVIVDGYGPNSGLYTTEANVYYNPGSEGSTDPNATPATPQTIQDLMYRGITSCSMLSTSGSGQVLGAGSVFIGDDANISPGSGIFEGDIYSPKTVTIGSGEVRGSVSTTASIIINNGGARVYGTLYGNAGINVAEGGAEVTGDLHSSGTISLEKGGIKVNGNLYTNSGVKAGSVTITGSIYSGGEINFSNTTLRPTSGSGKSELRSNADIVIDNSPIVQADLYTTTNISVTNSSTTINGNIYARGDIHIQGATINGNVYAGGKVVLNGGTVSGTIHEGTNALLKLAEVITHFPEPDLAQEFYGCEVQQNDFQLETEINNLKSASLGEVHPGIIASDWDSNVQWILREDGLSKSVDGGITEQVQPKPPTYSGRFYENEITFYRFRDFKTSAISSIAIKGNIIIVVDNPVEIRAPSTIKIDADSSLTIITSNYIQVKNNNGTSSEHGVINSNDQPFLSFYTSFGSETRKAFDYGSESKTLRAVVYAPNGDIGAHSATLEGGFVGNDISVSGGDGVIKYDKDLMDLIGKRGSSPSNGEEGLVIVKRR